MLRPAFAFCLLVLLLALAEPAVAQVDPFGSSDDPKEEIQQVWWQRESRLDVSTGLSLIGAQWRTAGRAQLDLVTRSITGRLVATLRAGVYGTYEPDIDEPYDLLRLVDFLRYEPPVRSRFYLRAGALDRIRLGTGHLVNFFNSDAAWDERTVGLQMKQQWRFGEVAAFTDNALLDGMVGARVALKPLAWADDPRPRSLTLGFNVAHDLDPTRVDGVEPGLTGYNADLQFQAVASGGIQLLPFVSVAWYDAYGSGLSFGADLLSENFIDLARFRIRLALFYNGDDFLPGYIGSFYQVSNPHARILVAEGGRNEDPTRLVGIALEESTGGTEFLTELRLLVFERFELWYYFRRHYGARSLSEYHLRAFLRTPRFVFQFGQDRGGLLGFFSLFNDVGDQTLLVFQTDTRIYRSFWAHIRARYSYERQDDAANGAERYLVQRRFEPFVGLRFRF